MKLSKYRCSAGHEFFSASIEPILPCAYCGKGEIARKVGEEEVP